MSTMAQKFTELMVLIYWPLVKEGEPMTLNLGEASYRILQELVQQTGQDAAMVLDKALDTCRRKVFLDQVNDDYAALRADLAAWAEVEAERRSMAGSLMDGLDPKERWGEDGDLLPPDEGKGHG